MRFVFVVIWLFCLGLFQSANAQCTIAAPRQACVNDLINFSINTSATVTAYNWNFGAYGNSSNVNPTQKFTSSGKVTVSCTLTLAGGGQCIDTHLIYIRSNPVVNTRLTAKSDSCENSNQICMENQLQVGEAALKSLTILWGDGNISNITAPLGNEWCHHYNGTGNFTQSYELADSAGCKAKYTFSVTIVPNPVFTTTTTVDFQCDSSRICFTSDPSSGGTTFTRKWKTIYPSTATGTGNPFCLWVQRGDFGIADAFVYNEYGCRDSIRVKAKAPDTSIAFSLNQHKFCSKTIAAGITIYAGQNVTWKYNGKPLGQGSYRTITSAKPGWNYLTISTNSPCPMQYTDSFEMVVFNVKAREYNEFRRKNIDTFWFIDLSKNAPGSRIRRLWTFGDNFTTQCTTWTAKNKFVITNCNYSKDSIAWHFDHNSDCPFIRLSLYDSVTGCEADTVFQAYRKDFCDPLIVKKKLCQGEYEFFNISKGMWNNIKSKNFLIPDVNKKDTLRFNGTSLAWTYSGYGWKTVIFSRYYGPDTVWTERNGKIVIDYIRPAQGWVTDTFKNAVYVFYKPKADFTLQKLRNCNPGKVKITFKDSMWLYPQKMDIIWGDTNYTVSGFKDTFTILKPMEHVYSKSGSYTIYITLYTKDGCTVTATSAVNFGNFDTFTFPPPCGNTICFRDTVRDFDGSGRWTSANKLGKLYWNFGDGKKDSGFNMCHTFPGLNTYQVTMLAVSNSGCSTSVSRTITLTKLVAAIKHQPTIYCSEIRQYFDSSTVLGDTNGTYLTKWAWDFGDGSKSVFIQNPAHIYPTGGTYTVRLVVTNHRGCTDTAYRTFQVLGPQVGAKILYDSFGCSPLKVFFGNLSKNVHNFIWEYGDPNTTFYSTAADTTVSFTYTKPGVYYAHLTGGDSFYNPVTKSKYYCSVTVPGPGQNQLRIRVFGGYHSEFTAPDTLCIRDSFVFRSLVDTAIKTMYKWNFGDGNTALLYAGDVPYSYAKAGEYQVTLKANAPVGSPCLDSARQKVVVYNPVLDFTRNCEKSHAPSLYFSNKSHPELEAYQWSRLDLHDSTETVLGYGKDLRYDFGPDTGLLTICLKMNMGEYCRDRNCKSFLINQFAYLANVFTPGSQDGFNDLYKTPFTGYEDFDLKIYNRWGELLFHSDNPAVEWNGKVNNTGLDLPAGTYFYLVRFKDNCDKKLKKLNGSINLIR